MGKQKRCCYCKKPVDVPFKIFRSQTYYSNYHRSHYKVSYWHEECWNLHEKKNEETAKKEKEELLNKVRGVLNE